MTTEGLCEFAAYLARSLSFSSVKQYLNIVRIIHLENGFENPLNDNFELQLVLRGIRRSLGDAVSRKAPITPSILRDVHAAIDHATTLDSSVWAASLVAFFGLLRRSNLVPNTKTSFDGSRQFRRGDFTFFPDRILVKIKWSKTVQFNQYSRILPLLALPNNVLCPVKAITNHFNRTRNVSSNQPAFVSHTHPPTPLTSALFVNRLRSILHDLKLPVDQFATHSFRRGGASYMLQSGISSEDIRILGDWKSNAYMDYIFHDSTSLQNIMRQFMSSV